MNKNTKIKVRNRSTGTVGYIIPDMGNYHRKFQPDEVKEVSFEEIQKLSYTPGGNYMLQHYLVIDNAEARDEILGNMIEIGIAFVIFFVSLIPFILSFISRALANTNLLHIYIRIP